MLLSNKYNFLFVHIAKTGGTSVRTALNKLRWRDPYYPMMFLCHRFSHLTGHKLGTKFPRHSKIIAAREMLPAEHFNQLFKFTFVRNPWDLQVSSFHHIRRERPQVMNGIDDFNEFMRWKFNPERPYQYHIDTSLQLQSDYLVDLHGNKLVDFIGRTENLQDDFDKVCETIGINPMTLPQKRVAKDRGKDYRAYYADDTAALVAQHFARDIEMFAYAFDQS
ncbi:MAG: sulfotransferase family 2 domain-containing protein [Thiotrichales bacterium]